MQSYIDLLITCIADALRYLYKRIAELEERNLELEEKLKIVLLV